MRIRPIGLLFIFFWSSLWISGADESSFPEYEVKAAYIYNFAKFVDWPKESLKEPDSPIVLTILGRHPFGKTLEGIENKTVGTHPIKTNFISTVSEINECHMLFICRSEADHMAEVISALGNRPILTISEVEYFAEKGGMIHLFTTDQRKIRFEINEDAAKSKGLRISSQLLKIARVVGKQENHNAQD
jgi:hypothetical protein